jgi:deazaflavin-dependent oxidoreductase (nitroreductase family)
MSACTDEQMAMLVKWSSDQLSAYINSGGVEGHIMDMRFLGGHRYATMLLLRYVGRKSGRTMIKSMGYAQFREEIMILASKAGAGVNPQWYLNLKAGSPLAFQVATQAFTATWREPVGDELEEAWTWGIKAHPLWANYRKVTTREIPVILLNPLEQIPVFSHETVTP